MFSAFNAPGRYPMKGDEEYLQKKTRPTWFRRIKDELLTLTNFFFGRRPLYQPKDLNEQPFFIIGSGRCGSTLTRAILNTHSKVAIPPESYVLGVTVIAYKRWSFLPWKILYPYILNFFENHKHFELWDISLDSVSETLRALDENNQSLHTIIDSIYRHFINEKNPEAQYWGDKSLYNTFYLPQIDQLFPRAKYVHLLRDGRDVASSFVDCGFYNNLETGMKRWKLSLELIKDHQQSIDESRFLEVKYEQLVTETSRTIKTICEFLNLNYEEKLSEYWKYTENLPDVGEVGYYKNVQNPISDDSVGRWKNLSQDDRQKLKKKLKSQLQEYDYSL
jgi:hypothetical protein